jgi:hypothetical protein
MKDHVFIDTDVILDVFALRHEFLLNSGKIFNLVEKKIIVGYTSTICVVNCNYLMEKAKIEDRKHKINLLRSLLHILPCTDKDIEDSMLSKFADFEDGIQNSIAINSKKCNTIITRNIKDYANSELRVCSPEQYLKQLKVK